MVGNKKAMEGYKSKMQMDDMPIDWVEQVITFLPLTEVYKCRSVCMAWHVAADRVLNDWETLVIGKKEFKTRSDRADKNHIVMQKDADCETWIKRLKQLVRLKRMLVTGDYYFWSMLRPVVSDVVFRNAATLMLLHVGWARLPFDPKHPVVFRNLRDLECSLRDPDQAAACPRLEKLRTSLTRHSCLQLYQETELLDRAICRLLTNRKELKEVDFAFPVLSVLDVDAVMETLAHNCLSMRSIRMDDARMTDAGLRSLARLTELQRLKIRSSSTHSDITTEGLLSLLRGGSRNVLQDLKLFVSAKPDLDRIRSEGQLMQQETGRSLSVSRDDSLGKNIFEIAIRRLPN